MGFVMTDPTKRLFSNHISLRYDKKVYINNLYIGTEYIKLQTI